MGKSMGFSELKNTMIFQNLFVLTVFVIGISAQDAENNCISLDEIKASLPQELQFNADVEMKHFNVLDTNGDGVLCEDEVKDKFQQFNDKVEALSENGCLSFENFMASIPEDLQADLEVEQDHFDFMDTNGDGKICEEEIMALDEQPTNRFWVKPFKKANKKALDFVLG